MPAPNRAISIKQPFVEQILNGSKTKEYRTVPTNIRERIYIYASLTPRREDYLWAGFTEAQRARLPRGLIVGSVEIIDCKPDRDGGFAYALANPKRLRTPLIPTNQPCPIFWRPKFADARGVGTKDLSTKLAHRKAVEAVTNALLKK